MGRETAYKVKTLALISAVLLLAAFVFASLWFGAQRDRADLKEMAQYEAGVSHSSFLEFQKDQSEASYWQAVSAFYAFEQAYYRYREGSGESYDFLVSNEVYGYLLTAPEKCRAHLEEIIAVMGLLANDAEDENACLQMSNLRSSLSE